MKKFILPLLLLFSIPLAHSQSYIGMEADNFIGIHGVLFNPATIADSRTKFDLNLLSVDVLVGTDYLPLTFENITKFVEDSGEDGDYQKYPSNSNQFVVTTDVLGPSLMLSLSEKHSIAIISRARLFNNYKNVNGQFLESMVDGFPDENFEVAMQNLNGTTHVWGEVGLAYGRTVFEQDYHFIKAGVTLKYLLGGVLAQGNSESLSATYDAAQSTLTSEGLFSYLLNYDSDTEYTTDKLTPGFGADLGVVYEYRPRDSRFSPNGEDERGFNKYKLKVGISLMDFGTITYKDLEQDTYNLNTTVSATNLDGDFEGKLEENYTKTTTVGDAKVVLPASLRVNVDYSFTRNLYASINFTQSLAKTNATYTNNALGLLTITPRFESKLFGLYTPINYSSLGGITFGAGLRLGPLLVGSGTLFSSLFSKKADMANVYIGLKVPFYQSRNSISKRKNKRRNRKR